MTTLRLKVDEFIRMATQAGAARVNRAAMLMACGWNTSGRTCADDLKLPGFIQLVDNPSISPDQLERFQSDYRAWIVGNGLREVVAVLETVLDAVHIRARVSD